MASFVLRRGPSTFSIVKPLQNPTIVVRFAACPQIPPARKHQRQTQEPESHSLWALPTPDSVSTACRVAPSTVSQGPELGLVTLEYGSQVRQSIVRLLCRLLSWRGSSARLIGPPHRLCLSFAHHTAPNLASPARIAGTKGTGLVFGASFIRLLPVLSLLAPIPK
ncbi:hypothetical protein CFAM422_004063 [Trichoderma lentiforme]|uniref:Uncharacterized protein n=1 Tax=Trichoderma lentiforme TaxID=1567552 RepID=A0A9P5CDA2_9HYPO|nr:hypothetical protein CFAM422_004063 [Trichoderma lentiforme]